tara:strand:- start:123 stop:551 length:429 start_codon:yes stop_codon:yes gene_type:complete
MFIDERLYKKIREVIPTACVDLIVINNNKFLLLKRSESPAKGEWWFPGGRIYKSETISETVERKGFEELNIQLAIKEVVSIEESIFTECNPIIHTINIVVSTKVLSKNEIKLDNSSHEYRWFSKIDNRLHRCVKRPLEKLGF